MANQNTKSASTSKKTLWLGRVFTFLPVFFLLFDSIIHIMNITPVIETMTRLGYPAHIAPALGIVEIICLLLYIIPRTSVLGAILLTGYLGGAVATHVRVEDPLFTHMLFPVYIGIILWGGVYFRDERLRSLIPVRKDS